MAKTTGPTTHPSRTTVTSEKMPEGCMRYKFSVYSPSMKREVRVIVLTPPDYATRGAKKYPILYTLHGMGAPYGTFSEMSTLRRELRTKPMIVTCFDADKASWYIDAANKQKVDDKQAKSLFTTFFFEEFIPLIDRHYRVDAKRRCVAGFSMGGFGAMYYMLTRPEMFVSASTLSAGTWRLHPPSKRRERRFVGLLDPYAANKSRYAAIDLPTRIAARAKKTGGDKLPPVYVHCGTEDRILPSARGMAGLLRKAGWRVEQKQSKGGHNWTFWKSAAPGMMDFHWRTLQKDYKPIQHTKTPTKRK